jgi:alkylated DNA repair dioxygenase AlkB
VDQVPWEITKIPMFGREVTEPRLSAWIADPGTAYRYSGRDRTVHDWLPVLSDLRDRAGDVAKSPFNGVLANLYRNGHDHMGWHADDERSLGPDPIIASVSLGADRRFDFRHRTTGEVVSTVLPHGSLLVMSGPVQRWWKHRIPKAPKVPTQRVNLTYRLLR